MKRLLALAVSCLAVSLTSAQLRYSNPVLHLDYSDPDVCRVGEDYYMTASSFNCFPGLPILHSKDLVNWELIGHALPDYEQDFHGTVQHGNGVWAPAIRYHEGWFYIYVGDPDRGIFMVRSQNPAGPWEAPVWVVKEKGFIDPCPFWDQDGNAWLSHGCAGSRAGIKSVLFMAPMAPDGTHLLAPSRIIYDGHFTQPTIEGTKLYKRDGWYYIFSPAGGVATGWQTVLRARHPYGPYEERIVMAWAPGTVNGPHQGAWVDTPEGENWFLHFQDKGAYGRIVHLQPMQWRSDGWPLIGEDPDGDGVGQPVAAWESPLGTTNALSFPQDWQWPSVPSPYWKLELENGFRLFSVQKQEKGLWNTPNLYLQKFPAERFTVTARMVFRPNPALKGEEAGFVVMGNDYAALRLTDTEKGAQLAFVSCKNAGKGGEESGQDMTLLPYTYVPLPHGYESRNVPLVNYPDRPEVTLWVKLDVRAKAVEGNVPDAVCRFSYSLDGKRFTQVKGSFTARPELWIGAKFGFYCSRYSPKNDAGALDVTDILVKPAYDPLEGFNYDEDKVPDYTLPELLVGKSGKPVTSVKEWEKFRRKEVYDLVETEYGTVPGRPSGEHFKVLSEGRALGGKAVRKEVAIYLDKKEEDVIHLLLYAPAGKRAAPCFLGVNFFGNHTICEDPQISLPDTLRYRPNFTVDARGSQQHRWPVETIIDQGFAVATFCCEDIAPDYDTCPGIRAKYPSYSWGHLAAWGWGLSRALDYLQEACEEVDGERVAVLGHSRMGKAAVWAGARDRRFKMVISNASGCGGAAISRRRYGETIRRINTSFPYWFSRDFHRYNDNEDLLPFDQHFLLALVAPRPLYVESGTEDRWSDPVGEKLGLEAALPVYRLYGAQEKTGYGIRPGKHEILLEDWLHYLEFARRHL